MGDFTQRTGSGLTADIPLRDARDTRVISNGGFDQLTFDGSHIIDIPGWESDTAIAGDSSDYTALQYSTGSPTNTYQAPYNEADTRYALNIKATRTLTRRLDVNVAKALPGPLFGQLAWNRQLGTGSGSLTVSVGGLTTGAIAVSAQTGWQTSRLPLTTAAWPRNLYAEPLTISIAWTRTAGDLAIDDFILVPFDEFAGQRLVGVGGATPAQERDFWTWTNTETGAVIQWWIRHAYEVSWNHSGTPTVADP